VTNVSGYRRGAAWMLSGVVVVAGVMLGTPAAWAEPGADAVSAINDRYAAFGGMGSLLGAPTADAVDVPGGAERTYSGGAIYYSKDTGAHVMYGAILDRYQALGGPMSSGLGFPKNDESDTGDGTGRFNDFSAPEGASIYWTPQWGASVVKGRVLEAWRGSGGVTGPFGYPSADTSIADGLQTGKFVGPQGTEIQWSQAAGLVTVPAALAAKIPGFGSTATTSGAATPTAEGTTSVTKPAPTGPVTPAASTKSSKWWWIPAVIAALALLAGLGRLLRRKPEPEPVRVAPARAPEVSKPTPPPPPRPAPVTKTAPPAPPRPATPPPAKVVPLAKTPPPPRPAPAPPPAPVTRTQVPQTVVHNETDHDVAAVIHYETHSPAETTIRVTYENNAIGDDQESVADKSDSIPDSRQL